MRRCMCEEGGSEEVHVRGREEVHVRGGSEEVCV